MRRLVDDRLLALFFLAFRGFAAQADEPLAREGLARMHHRVLYTVRRAPGICVGELALALGISRQALHRPLSELLRRGYVTARASAENRRERTLALTARGRRSEQRASAAQLALLGDLFTAHGRRAEAGFVTVLSALAEPIAKQAPQQLAPQIARGLREVRARSGADERARPARRA